MSRLSVLPALTLPLALAGLLALGSGCEFHGGPGYPPIDRAPGPGPGGPVLTGGGGGYGTPAPEPEYVPDSVEPTCGSVTEVGQCDGQLLQFCFEGELFSYDCPSYGLECGWDIQNDWFECLPIGTSTAPPAGPTRTPVPVGTCSVLPEGECALDILTYCDDGVDVMVDCIERGQVCGWVDENGWFDCVDPLPAPGPGPTPVPGPGPDGCGDLTLEGMCSALGTEVVWCEDGAIQSKLCADGCGFDADSGYFDCLPPLAIDECGDVTSEGLCDLDTLLYCEDGELVETLCAEGCGFDESAGYFDCLTAAPPIDECGDVTYEGICDGDNLLFCEDGTLSSSFCDHGCGWDEGNGYYDCL